ncbi:MAG: aminotransferase class V-fold PLP-dependent enzyme [Asticcacaulis sp.]
MHRRTLFVSLGALLPAMAGAHTPEALTTPSGAMDEKAWARIAAAYPPRPAGVTNLEFGAFGQMPLAVQSAFARYSETVNQQGAYFTRRDFAPYYMRLRQQIAAALNADPSEIALTRNATEAMQALIGGYNRLKPDDAVLMADHDYDSMQTAIDWLKQRRGVEVLRIQLPHPATHQNLIDAYEQALKTHPNIRLILLTHIGHRSGLRLPVRDIIDMARQQGVDALVDSAHAWGQMPVDVKAEGFDFAGFNLHKWIGAPLGVGALYIRRDRIGDIDPFMGEWVSERDPVSARVHTGTANFAAQMAAIDALNLHRRIGSPACAQRLSYLRDLWAEPARDLKTIDVLTPEDPRLRVGITSFRLRHDPSPQAHAAFAKRLLDEYGLFTVLRTGLGGGACIRLTPGFGSTPDDMTRLLGALKALSA